MRKRNYLVFLDDILESINRIEEYIHALTYVSFSENNMVFDAVIRNLEVIGEAARNIPDDIRQEYTEIPWQQMVGLRNILIHEYFGIDKRVIWKIITDNLPSIKPSIEKLYNEL